MPAQALSLRHSLGKPHYVYMWYVCVCVGYVYVLPVSVLAPLGRQEHCGTLLPAVGKGFCCSSLLPLLEVEVCIRGGSRPWRDSSGHYMGQQSSCGWL